jgi:phage terminase small subunit
MCDDLTIKQRRFIEEYCTDFNGAAAARRAGYSPRSARQTAFEILQRPEIRSAIAERLEVFAQADDIETVRLFHELKCLAHFNILDLLEVIADGSVEALSAADRDVTAAVCEISFDSNGGIARIKFHDKLGALKQLAQIKGLTSEAQTLVAGPALTINGNSNDDTRRLARELIRCIAGGSEGEPGGAGAPGVS